jgi:hypothetical protein
VVTRLKRLGILPVGNSSQEFSRILTDDIAGWTGVAKVGNIKLAP